MYIYIYIYIYETCAWTQNKVFPSKMFVEISAVQIQVKTVRWDCNWSGTPSLRHLGSGTWQPAMLVCKLSAAGLRT